MDALGVPGSLSIPFPNARTQGLFTGLDRVKSGSVEVYHVEQIDQATRMMAQVYGQIMSIVALFLTMVIICAIFPRLHAKIADEATVGRFGTNLAIGLGILIAVPIVAIFAFFTLLAAPLGIIALALYLIAIYLAQGFAGAWLGYWNNKEPRIVY